MSVELTRLPGVKVGTIPYYSASQWTMPASDPVIYYVPTWDGARMEWKLVSFAAQGVLTTAGDMLYRNVAGAVTRLPIGNIGDIMVTSNGGGGIGVPGWTPTISHTTQLSGLSSDDHTQYLKADGTRNLTGNMAVTAGVTFDAVDVGAHTHTGAGSNGPQVTMSDIATASTTHTPTVTQGGTVTSFTVNATRYQTEGGWITLSGYVSINNAGTAAGANNVTFSLPINAVDQAGHIVGSGAIFDSSAGLYYRAHVAIASATTVFFYPVANANNAVLGSDTFVAALATGDIISFTARYRK